MSNDFFDWLFDYGHEGIALVFMFSAAFFLIGFAIAFVGFIMPDPLLRFEVLMATIMFSIFITWYLRVYKK